MKSKKIIVFSVLVILGILFGTLGAILAAELYVIFKQEEKMSVDEQENEYACKCHCCHCKEEENKDEEI